MDLPPVLRDHEALCRRCGMSCHPAIVVGNQPLILPELHCKFLGRDAAGDAFCTVYDRRFELAPWCLHASYAKEIHALAHDCPYAASTPGYPGKRWATEEQRSRILPQVVEKLLREGLPVSYSVESAVRLLGEDWTYAVSPDGLTWRFHLPEAAESAAAPSFR